MLKYYEINGKTCFTDHMDFQCPPEADWKEIPEPRTAEELSENRGAAGPPSW